MAVRVAVSQTLDFTDLGSHIQLSDPVSTFHGERPIRVIDLSLLIPQVEQTVEPIDLLTITYDQGGDRWTELTGDANATGKPFGHTAKLTIFVEKALSPSISGCVLLSPIVALHT